MNKQKTGSLFIISGPSGTGKSTVIAEVLKRWNNMYFSVSFTTRAPRKGETDGVNYNFVNTAEFERMIAAGELLEYASYSGHYYGSSAKLINEKLASGMDVLLDIEVVGSKIVHDKLPETPMIFLSPPSFEELSRRLHARGTDSEDVIQTRLNRAKEEINEIPRYDYLVINDTVENAADEIVAILTSEHCRTAIRLPLVDFS